MITLVIFEHEAISLPFVTNLLSANAIYKNFTKGIGLFDAEKRLGRDSVRSLVGRWVTTHK